MNSDEMFEELGYEKKAEGMYVEYINKKDDVRISFLAKSIQIRTNSGGFEGKVTIIYAEELKAINKKCEELGWL